MDFYNEENAKEQLSELTGQILADKHPAEWTVSPDIGERWYSSTFPVLEVLRQTTRFTFIGLFNRVLSSNVSYKEIRSQVNDHDSRTKSTTGIAMSIC